MDRDELLFLREEGTPEVEAFKDSLLKFLRSQPGYYVYKDSLCTTIGRKYYTYKEPEGDSEERDWLGYEYRPGSNFER